MGAAFVFPAMGTMVSITSQTPIAATVEDELRVAFEELEARFSLFRLSSEAARVAARTLPVRQASPQFRSVYATAVQWRAATDGAFTPHRSDGVVDLSGIVKGLAIDRAGSVLAAAGHTDWVVNAGGDVLAAGRRVDGRPWVVGVVAPEDRSTLVSQVAVEPGRAGVATSGLSERGDHIWRLGADATFVQVTVLAADIVTADVLATAILAGGPDTLRRVQARFEIEVLAFTHGDLVWASPSFRAA